LYFVSDELKQVEKTQTVLREVVRESEKKDILSLYHDDPAVGGHRGAFLLFFFNFIERREHCCLSLSLSLLCLHNTRD
jgi:hypothetical protein